MRPLSRTLDTGKQITSPRNRGHLTIQLAINELHSARAGGERYFGEWLPEPIITDAHGDPAR